MDALLNGRLGTLVSPTDKNAIQDAIVSNLKQERTVDTSLAIQTLCVENFSYHQYYIKIKQAICEG